MAQPEASPTVAGRLVMAPGAPAASPATFRVVARAGPSAENLAVPVQSDGSFAIWVPDEGATAIQVLGPTGRVVAERDVDAHDGDTEVRDLGIVVGERFDDGGESLMPTFVDSAALATLRMRIDHAVAAGELSAGAQKTLGRLEAILGALDDLLPDAHRALAGDDAAAHRFRRGLLAVPTLGSRPTAPPPVAPDRGPGRLWGQFLLAGACAWIVTDEFDFVEVHSALAGALDAILQFDLLLSVPNPAAGTLRSLMVSMGGFDGGGFDGGLGPDVPGFPGLPNRPGGGVIGGPLTGPSIADLWVHGPRVRWDPVKRRFDVGPPLYVESCIERAIREMSKLRSDAPHWLVTSIEDAAACVGQVIVLTGSGFGSSGVVYFNATGVGTEVPGSTISWSDTSISVRVPPGAHPGPIRLQVPMGTASFCGGVYVLTRIGQSDVMFAGGLPEIHYLDSDWKNGPVILPDTDAIIDFGYSAADGVTGSVRVSNGSTTIANFTSLTGGTHQLTFRAPPSAAPMVLRVDATASTLCGTVSRTLLVTVAVPPKLAIVGIEAIQAVQRPDPLTTGTGLGSTLRLAERKRTAVRVYVVSGLPPTFSYETPRA